jgi:alpha-ribazole phosphatase
MKLYLVRHAQPLVASGVCYGASDVACDPRLIQTAAQQLQHELPQGLRIISSPLQRCEHLAQNLCRLEPTFDLKIDTALAEMNFGHWEMQPWRDIAPHEISAWTDDFAHYRCGHSGESTAQFVQRVAIRVARSVQEGQDEVWITHAGVIRALLWMTRQEAFRMWMATLIARPPMLSFALQARETPAPPRDLLSQLRAADWPQDAVAWSQVLKWDWPQA